MKNFIIDKKDNLILVRSLDPLNELAPSWSFNLWMYHLTDKVFLLELKTFLLENKSKIIKNFKSYNDGGTGLGNDTTTSRYNTFNLFRENNSVVSEFKKIINYQFRNYLEKNHKKIFDLERFSPKINCWYNIMNPGEFISSHTHNLTRNSFISGHFTVQCEKSYTYYICPYSKDILEFENNNGEGIFFPSYLEHGTSVHEGFDKRITIAFDIYFNDFCVSESIKNNLVDLYDY